MSELQYVPLEQKDLTYLRDCPFRKKTAGSTFESCSQVEAATGLPQAVNPITCAHCQSDGESPNSQYLRGMIRSHLFSQIQLVLMGFCNKPEQVMGLFKRAWDSLSDKEPDSKAMADMLEKCVKGGRLSQEHAIELVKNHIPELGEVDL